MNCQSESEEERWPGILLGRWLYCHSGMNSAVAQEFPPGYVDPDPLLAAAAEEIGEAGLRCITFSGNGYSGAVGQTFENAVNVTGHGSAA